MSFHLLPIYLVYGFARVKLRADEDNLNARNQELTMADANDEKVKGITLAGGAIAFAVLESLHAKGVLTPDECRDILSNALNSLGPVMQTPAGIEAAHVITDLMQKKFSSHG